MKDSQQYLDQYELQQCLRRDTTSEVWKAFDSRQHRCVTLTLLRFTLPTGEAIHRFLYETRGLVALQHPHLVSVFEVRILSRTTSALTNSCEAYIVMDYIESLSLAQYLQTLSQAQKIASAVEIMHILAPIASAIDYIHQQGIIHGLIKPCSILLGKNNTSDSPLGEPKLAELGMHNTYDPHQLLPKEVCYIAPEIIQGYTDNVRSDLYSLGIILYEMCTGVLPFSGNKTDEVINQQLNVMPASPVLVNPLIEPELTAVIMHSLAKKPVARFPSASLMVDALAKALKVPMSQFSGQSSVEKSPPASIYNRTVLSPVPQMPHTFPPGALEPSASQPNVIQIPVSNPQITPQITPEISTPHQSMTSHSVDMSSKQDVSPASGSSYDLVDRNLQAQTTPSPESVLAGMASSVRTTPPPVKRKQHNLYTALAILVVLVLLIGSGWSLFSQPATVPKPLVGHAFFVSSGLMDLTSARGIADGLQVHLENLSDPSPGKSYYAWLLAGSNQELDALPVLLGTLAVHNNQARLDYPGDANHSNLLSKYNHLLITEEDSNLRPANPSPNTSTWQYAAAFSRTPDPQDTTNHFSLFDHLRHLLSQDPKIKKLGLVGGLDTWLYRNTLKILEWSGSARDLALSGGDTGLIRRQLVRILDYLDGAKYVQTENLPPDLPPVLVDPVIAQVALLEISPTQDPPGYLKHISKHLYGITQSPGVTSEQKQLALEINSAMDNVQTWLTDLHKDAEELIHKPADQLVQPQTFPLFNDMFELANNAFVSQTDPHTGQVKEGVAQIHYKIQSLATFDIAECKGSNTSNFCI
jgi:eukaryotic-like serine/threonine-protein kinase